MEYRTYTAHMRPLPWGAEVSAHDVVLVPEKGSFWAFLFGPFWALYHRMWGLAAVLLLIIFGGGAFTGFQHQDVIVLALAAFLGLEGFHLKRWSLSLKGYVELGVVGGDDEDMAAERFYRLLQRGQFNIPRFGPEAS
tara:strand:- start:5664 stop:6074 length:411 start_codon:yes stop_codon:yes gene_type:complete